MENSDTIRLLDKIYSGSEAACTAISDIMPSIDNADLKNVLIKFKSDYTNISSLASKQLSKLNKTADELSSMQKVGMWFNVKFEMLKDDSIKEVATFIINGDNMGVHQITKELENSPNASKESRKLGSDFVDLLNKHIEIMRNYKP